MSLGKFKYIAIIFILFLIINVTVEAKYLPTNRDTRKPPETITYDIEEPSEFEVIYETENLKYFFKEDRDVIAIYDKRNGYTWKTGIDIPFNKDLDDICDDAPEEEKNEKCYPLEERLNTTYTGIANSLITVEYFGDSNSIKRVSSASYKNVESELKTVNGDDSHRRLDIRFKKIDLNIKLHIYFTDKGIQYEIKDEEITGEGQNVLASIIISPFLGATGGQKKYWDEVEQDYEITVPNEMIDGYFFVPDGSGGLIRFNDNNTKLGKYIGDVYGVDRANSDYYVEYENFYVPFKNPILPVFGVTHGHQQSAFVSYAISGAEYMEIIAMPEDNTTYYNWIYPRFEYNDVYFQIYNQKGDGYFSTLEDRHHYDISIAYEFLEGDGKEDNLSADYVGMANAYRNHLLDNNELNNKDTFNDIPIRLDFVMSDTKKSVLGFEDVVLTNINDVEQILVELSDNGVKNISSGLLGWQKGGITLGKPWTTKWKSDLGKKSEFEDTISMLKDIGIDVSLSQNYSKINSEQMNLNRNAVKHASGWHLIDDLLRGQNAIERFSYARPVKATKWLSEHIDKVSFLDLDSITIEGISNVLTSDYTGDNTSVSEAIELYKEAFSNVSNDYKVNSTSPNGYLLSYVDRFLQSPVYTTQYLIETDTVPFLQMVLSSNIEMYAPYSNFSFSNKKDVLRMIDYNVYPSFVLSKEPSYLLSSTNSSNFYSTEYSIYKDKILDIYSEVNEALGSITNSVWINREILEDGIILNTYNNGNKIIINYTDEPFIYNGIEIDSESFKVISMGDM